MEKYLPNYAFFKNNCKWETGCSQHSLQVSPPWLHCMFITGDPSFNQIPLWLSQLTNTWHYWQLTSTGKGFMSHSIPPPPPQKKEISVSVAWDLMYHRLSRRMWQAEMVRDHSTGYTRAGLHTDAVFIYTSFWEAHEIKKWVICNCSQRYWATWTTK